MDTIVEWNEIFGSKMKGLHIALLEVSRYVIPPCPSGIGGVIEATEIA
jgi:hypothetical protein